MPRHHTHTPVAANFTILGRIIRWLGLEYSHKAPMLWRQSSFCAASEATQSRDPPLCQAKYPWQDGEASSKVHASRDDRHDDFHRYPVCPFLPIVFLYSVYPDYVWVRRTIYRVAEFIDGWDGKINSTQWPFSK